MTVDPMERLARANPVPEPPVVASPEGLRRLIEHDSPSGSPKERPRKRAYVRRGALVGTASVVCASMVTVLLLAGSSDPGLNVLAAVYAATAPKQGIVEAVTITHTYGGPGHDSVDRLREWSDASTGLRRGLTSIEGSPSRPGGGQIDVVYTPSMWEAWSNARGSGSLPWNRAHTPNVVHRFSWSGSFHPNDQHMGFLGGGLVGAEWAELFRALYSKGQMRVVGHERHAGRLLWKLEASPARAKERAREDHTQFYVLVDPHTFLPVYTRLINLALAGHPTIYESELLSYRTLPSTPANEKLFDLTLQHPEARVVSQTVAKPPTQPGGR